MHRGHSILLALLILISGCAGSNPSASTEQTAVTISPTETPTTTTPPTAVPTTEPTPEPIYNPWQKEPITVGVDSVDEVTESQVRAVRRGIEYWNTNGSDYADWEPSFVFEPNSSNPDLLVRFERIIVYCDGYHADTTIGCAPVLDSTDLVYGQERVQIQIGLTNESTYRVVRHELGHVLGLEHGDEPIEVMAAYDIVFNREYQVDIDYDDPDRHDRGKTRLQVERALNYYNAGADGHVKENITFKIVDDPVKTDVQITFTDGQGFDGSIGEYDQINQTYNIEIEGIDDDRRAWHVGYWLGFFSGAQSEDELPPPFDDPENDVREYWWR